MRIALTFNEKRSADAVDTSALARTIASLGHTVTPVEVSGPVDHVIAALRVVSPDLVFNLAEGTHGTFREAFYPALFEQLGLAHTGSDAATLALCMNKALAKRIVAAARVQTPASHLVRTLDDLAMAAPLLPAIVKPNSDFPCEPTLVTTAAALEAAVAGLLATYPDGVLVEQYIVGSDVSVTWIEGLGILPTGGDCPERLVPLAQRAFSALGVTGYGRAHFRVTDDGHIYFLEMNPLPALDPKDRDVLGTIIESVPVASSRRVA